MNCTATARLPARIRLAVIVAGLFALLGSFVAPAQAGYYGDSYYRPYPCTYRCGYPGYRYYNGCSWCGGYRRSVVYERRYIEREFVERRYSYGGSYRRPCGYYSYGGCYRRYGYYPYGGYRRPWAMAMAIPVSGVIGHCRSPAGMVRMPKDMRSRRYRLSLDRTTEAVRGWKRAV